VAANRNWGLLSQKQTSLAVQNQVSRAMSAKRYLFLTSSFDFNFLCACFYQTRIIFFAEDFGNRFLKQLTPYHFRF
jgi:hypothetical protein